jgi:hypothetical protein
MKPFRILCSDEIVCFLVRIQAEATFASGICCSGESLTQSSKKHKHKQCTFVVNLDTGETGDFVFLAMLLPEHEVT